MACVVILILSTRPRVQFLFHGAKILGLNKLIPKLIKLDYSHFDKLAFSANLDIRDCDIKDNIKLAGELRQYDPGVGGQNAALRFFFEVREALERSTQSNPNYPPRSR